MESMLTSPWRTGTKEARPAVSPIQLVAMSAGYPCRLWQSKADSIEIAVLPGCGRRPMGGAGGPREALATLR